MQLFSVISWFNSGRHYLLWAEAPEPEVKGEGAEQVTSAPTHPRPPRAAILVIKLTKHSVTFSFSPSLYFQPHSWIPFCLHQQVLNMLFCPCSSSFTKKWFDVRFSGVHTLIQSIYAFMRSTKTHQLPTYREAGCRQRAEKATAADIHGYVNG